MRSTPRTRRPARLLAVGIAAALVVAGCSGDDDASDAPADDSAESADADAGESADDAAIAEATERAEAAEAQAAEAEAAAEAAVAEAEAANQRAEEADAQLADATSTLETLAASETVRADTAEDEVQRFSDLFPIVVESTLSGIELDQEGVWDLTWTEAYCDTFATCGTLPTTRQATFSRTPENFLRVVVPGILDAGLFSVEGSLYAITDSETALPPCDDGTPRVARITITTYADDIQVESDGSRSVTGLEGSITIDSTSRTGCPGGLVFYGVQMSRPPA